MRSSVLRFFPRQTVVGGEPSVWYYSDPFDLSQYTELTVCHRVLGIVGSSTQIAGTLQTTPDLHDVEGWSTGLTFALRTAVGSQRKSTSGLSRFVRFEVIVINPPVFDGVATIQVEGVAREGKS
jgi:hypothetical protein